MNQKSIDKLKNVSICFPNPENCIGIEINKTNTKAVCVGFSEYIRKDGEPTYTLKWEVTLKSNYSKRLITTSYRIFRLSDIPSTEKTFIHKDNLV